MQIQRSESNTGIKVLIILGLLLLISGLVRVISGDIVAWFSIISGTIISTLAIFKLLKL